MVFTVAFATLLFSRQAGASPAGVFANIASCKCLTADDDNLSTTDCPTDLRNLSPSQSFSTEDFSDESYIYLGLFPVCVEAIEAPHSIVGQHAKKVNCRPEKSRVYAKNSKLVMDLRNYSYDLKRAEDDTLVFAEPDSADDHIFEFHCADCFGDEDWKCGGSPAPAPLPDPSPTPAPAPAPLGNTTTSAPTPPNTTLAPDTTPAPSAGVQIQWTKDWPVNLCMDLPGGDTSNGALLWMWDCYEGETQQWSFQDGQLVYLPDPSKCVDLLGDDTTNGNKLGIWDCYQGNSQLWGFDSDWGTIYLASSTASDATKCASVGGEQRGDPIDIWDCSFDGGQQQLYQTWKVESLELSLAVV